MFFLLLGVKGENHPVFAKDNVTLVHVADTIHERPFGYEIRYGRGNMVENQHPGA